MTRKFKFVYFTEKTISFQELASAHMIYKSLMSIATFLVTLGLLHILRYNRTISILAGTLSDAKGRLGAFGLFCLAFVFAFAALTHCLFGAEIFDFRSLGTAYIRLAVRHMDIGYKEVREAGGVIGVLIMLVFVLTTMTVILNVAVTLINDALSALQADDSRVTSDSEVIQYMFSLLHSSKPKVASKGTGFVSRCL